MIEALNVKASMLFNLVLANNTFLSCFFFYFLVIDLYFISHVVCAHIFNPIAELIILIGLRSSEAKAETKIYPVTTEAKISKCSIQFKVVETSFSSTDLSYYFNEIISCCNYVFNPIS